MPAVVPTSGKVADLTGPGITDRFGMLCTDLGATVRAADGNLVSVFGDTFSGHRVGVGDWRSPVILIGTGDATHGIVYHRAAGADRGYARQLWRYRHSHNPGLLRRGISTVIPSDLLRVGDTLYLHAIVNQGFGNVVWTEIWRSDDDGETWCTPARSSPLSSTAATPSAGRGTSTRKTAGCTWCRRVSSATRG